jgi:hypothetical protein
MKLNSSVFGVIGTATVALIVWGIYQSAQPTTLADFGPGKHASPPSPTPTQIVAKPEEAPITPKEESNVAALSPPTPVIVPSVRQVALSQLWSDYDSNSIRADSLYLRQTFTVSGVVFKVDRDGDGHPFLSVADDSEGTSGIICYFSQFNEYQPGHLEKGQLVTVRGIGVGRFNGIPMMADCSIVSQ